MSRRSFSYFLLILLLCTAAISTQSYHIQTYSVIDGLPSGLVTDLTQNVDGKMWFSSNIGILEFDNQTWKLHNITPQGMNKNQLSWITSDQYGRIFVFNRNLKAGGYLYENKIWKRLDGPDARWNGIQITSLSIQQYQGKTVIGFGTYKKGLFLYSVSENRWRHMTAKIGLLDNDILSIDSYQGKFYTVTKKGISIVSSKLVDNSINQLIPDHGKQLTGIRIREIAQKMHIFVTARNWIGEIIDNKFKYIRKFPFQIGRKAGDLLSVRKIQIEYDRRGRLFFGNITALYYYDFKSNELKRLDTESGLVTRGITSIIQDREYNIWTGTRRGINKIISLQFENYSRQNGLLEDEVTSINEIPGYRIIFGHNNGLTIKTGNRYQKIPLEIYQKRHIINTRIYDIFIENNQFIWAAAGVSGLFKLNMDSNFSLVHHWPCPESAEYTSVIKDHEDRIWVGSRTGLFQIKNRQLIPASTGLLPSPYVKKIFKFNHDELYFATNANGVYYFKDNQWGRFYSKKDLKFNSTYAVLETEDKLLIGSSVGLLTNNGQSLSYAVLDGQKIKNPVYFISTDRNQQIWIGTNRGVFIYDRKSLRHFSQVDGLVGTETNRDGGFIDSRNNLWIGMDQGVSRYKPELNFIPHPKPLLQMEKILANNRIHHANDKTVLRSQTTLEFFFKGISFLDNQPLVYQYKLIGYDKDWQKAILRDGYLRYSNLHHGKYIFQIKTSNSKGIESNLYTTHQIRIHPPFYLTYWFLFSALLFIFLSTLLIKKYYRQIKLSKLLKKEIYRKDIQLKESLISYQSLFEESLDCIFTSTPDGMFLSINEAGLDMFGYSSLQEISQRNIQNDIYLEKGRRDEFKKLMKKHGFVKNFESKVKRKDGSVLIVIESSYLIKDSKGKIIGYRGIIRDITDQIKLQSQLVQAQKMESIGLLAGGIAHDFNNILSGIMGYANLLKRALAEDKQAYRYVKTIERSAERAAELTAKLLGFARKGKYKVASIQINDIISDVTNLLNPIIDKSIKIKSKLSDSQWLIEADATQVQQIIMNICLNARDALPNGGIIKIESNHVQLTESTQKSFAIMTKPGHYIRVAIKDNGFGIKKEYLSKIFDPFFTTKKGTQGSGLGLSMVYGVIKNHNGALNVQSIDGKETVFELFFPARKIEQADSVSTRDKSDSEEIKTNLEGKESILIIDDESVHREMLKNILNENGYTVYESRDGLEGSSIFLKNQLNIDLVILDMSMPEMGGNATFIKLRELDPDIKIIINSGYAIDENISKILQHQQTDFIQKPFKPRKLLIKIRALLD